MDKNQIKSNWRDLKIHLVIGILIILGGLTWFYIGSKKSIPQSSSIFITLFGVVLSVFTLNKIREFKKYLDKNQGV